MQPSRFTHRRQAGQVLASRLQTYAGRSDVIVLALPRGGVPVGYEVAKALGAPLDVFIVRKLGVPGQEELAMGAIASGGVVVLNEQTVRMMNVSLESLQDVIQAELAELARREQAYRSDRPALDVQGKTVILVDDGLATGASMKAAARALRHLHPAKIVVAVPVAAAETCEELRREVDEAVCAVTPEPFQAVGLWYDDFSQTTDQEVSALLHQPVPAE